MKLYWRVKINGKWTWRPAELVMTSASEGDDWCICILKPYEVNEDGR